MEFGDLRDSLIKDILNLSERLLRQPDLTLKKPF